MTKRALFTGLACPAVLLFAFFVAVIGYGRAQMPLPSDCPGPDDCGSKSGETTTTGLSNITWAYERVDVPKRLSTRSNSWLKMDQTGHPHVAYGGHGLIYAYHDGSQWQKQTVDDDSAVVSVTSLALDSGDRPHIAYVDGNRELIKYAYYDGNQWHIEDVPDSDIALSIWMEHAGIALALDNDDEPAIAFTQVTVLSLARHSDGMWTNQTVASGCPLEPSLAFDQENRPHIAYGNGCYNHSLKMADWNGSSWLTQTVHSEPDPEWSYTYHSPSLVLDPADQPHLAFKRETEIYYAWLDGDSWQAEEIGSSGSSWGVSLALDDQDRPHIVGQILYATFDGQDWQTEPIDPNSYPAIAINGDNQPCFGGYNDTSRTLRFTTFDSQDWSSEDIDTDDESVVYPWGVDMAMGNDHALHVSYFEQVSGYLMYAQKLTSTWTTESIAPALPPSIPDNRKSSLDLDSQDRPVIAYYGYESGSLLQFARWTGSTWLTETVDTADTDYPLILQLDSLDHPHIAYSNRRYAVWNGSTWDLSTVDSPVEQEFWMALDSQDHPHFILRGFDYSENMHMLIHTYWTGVEWQSEPILTGTSALALQLAIDQDDNLHLLYHDNDSGDVTYGMENGSGWSFEILGTVYSFIETDLALDADGNPHAAFHGDSIYWGPGNMLIYAARVEGSWAVQPVDQAKAFSAALVIGPRSEPYLLHTFGGLYLARRPELTESLYLPVLQR